MSTDVQHSKGMPFLVGSARCGTIAVCHLWRLYEQNCVHVCILFQTHTCGPSQCETKKSSNGQRYTYASEVTFGMSEIQIWHVLLYRSLQCDTAQCSKRHQFHNSATTGVIDIVFTNSLCKSHAHAFAYAFAYAHSQSPSHPAFSHPQLHMATPCNVQKFHTLDTFRAVPFIQKRLRTNQALA